MTDSRDYFNRHAKVFSEQYSCGRPDFVERVAVWTQAILRALKPGMRVVDLGCGEGTLSRIVAQQGNECLGIDQSPHMIALAESSAEKLGLASRLRYVTAKLPYMSDPDAGSFGLLLCSSVLEYVDDLESVVRSFAMLAQPGATLLVSFPNRTAAYRHYERVRRYFPLRANSYLKYQRHVLSEHDARALLNQCGFLTQQVQYYGQPPMKRLFGHGPDRFTKTLFLVTARRAAKALRNI